MNTKQVVVIRKDLNMRKGKIAAQCCHASMAFLTKKGVVSYPTSWTPAEFRCYIKEEDHAEEIFYWLRDSFKKIVCYVNSEEELDAIHNKALEAGLISHLVEDNGATEFNGVKTKTCCAIGPHWDNKFEGVTDHLPLL